MRIATHSRRFALLGSLLLPCSFIACSIAISTDGLSDGQGAATSGVDAAAADGGANRDARDGVTVLPDGAVVRPPDGGVARPCAQAAPTNRLVCDDFDDRSVVTTALNAWKTDGIVSIDTAKAKSPAGSLLVVTDPVPAGKVVAADIYRALPSADRLRASWSMLNEAGNCEGNTSSLYFRDANNHFYVDQIQIGKNGRLEFQEYGEPGNGADSAYSLSSVVVPSTPAGEWLRIVMTYNRTALGGPVLSVSVNDVVALNAFKLRTGVGFPASGPTDMIYSIGLTYIAGNQGGCRARFDDVMLETF